MSLALIPRTNPASLKKSSRIIGRQLIIFRSNKMKPLLNAPKKTKTIRAGSLKKI